MSISKFYSFDAPLESVKANKTAQDLEDERKQEICPPPFNKQPIKYQRVKSCLLLTTRLGAITGCAISAFLVHTYCPSLQNYFTGCFFGYITGSLVGGALALIARKKEIDAFDPSDLRGVLR